MQLKTLPRGTSWTRSGSTPAIFCARAAGAAFPWGFITSSRNQWVSQSFSAAWGETGGNRTQLAWHQGIYASKILPTHSSHQIPSKSAWSQNLFLHLSSASPGGHKKTLESLKSSDLGKLQLCSIKTVQVLQNLSYIWNGLCNHERIAFGETQ